MLLELSEILACPNCGPPQVMVAVVDEARGTLVQRGFLACPACDRRFPIDAEAVHFQAADAVADGPNPAGAGTRAPVSDTALLVAALLGLERGSGHLLFGPGLAAVARAVADLNDRWSVMSVSPQSPELALKAGPVPPNLSCFVVPSGVPLPVQSGRVWGMAIGGRDAEPLLAEAARVLVPGGRLAILDPTESGAAAVERAGLEVRAADGRAILAARPLPGRS